MAALRVKFKNPYDKEITKRFYRTYILRSSFFMYFIAIFGLISLVMLLSGNIKYSEDDSFTYLLMWSIAIIGIFFVPGYLLLSVAQAVRRDQKNRGESIEVVEVSKEKIVRGDIVSGNKVVISWYNLAKIVEKDDAFYFYYENDDAFPVAKAGLIEGTLEELRKIITISLKKDKKGNIPFKTKNPEYLASKKALKEKK